MAVSRPVPGLRCAPTGPNVPARDDERTIHVDVGTTVDEAERRARRRLVGAVALVLAVVIGLPMVLDSEPKLLSSLCNPAFSGTSTGCGHAGGPSAGMAGHVAGSSDHSDQWRTSLTWAPLAG